jgi:hypothetical protein
VGRREEGIVGRVEEKWMVDMEERQQESSGKERIWEGIG